MDEVLKLISRLTGLIHEVNRLITNLPGNRSHSFLEGAEQGIDIQEYDLSHPDDVELYQKRKESFELYNKIMDGIMNLSPEEKIAVDKELVKALEFARISASDNYQAYKKAVEEINKPDFPEEQKNRTKMLISQLKDNYTRYETASTYYNNIHHYLNVQVRSK
jgi:hypothetical protein